MTDTVRILISLAAIAVALVVFVVVKMRARAARSALLAEIERVVENTRTKNDLIPASEYRVLSIQPSVSWKAWVTTLAFEPDVLVRLRFLRHAENKFEFEQMDIAKRVG